MHETRGAPDAKVSGANERLRIVVLGYIVRGPLGGMAWSDLHYLVGLASLDHDVYFVEDSCDYPSCFDPIKNEMGVDPAYGLRFAARALETIGMGDRWAYYDAHTSQWFGPCGPGILAICKSADVVLNLAGVNPLRPWLRQIPVRVLIDKDPVFTQLRHLAKPEERKAAAEHSAFFSFGENIDLAGCTIPSDGLSWQATRHPIALRFWPATPGPARGRFTTVMQWESYPAREYRGIRYGTKAESFAPYLDLPGRSDASLELAVKGTTAPRELLAEKGWIVRDPFDVTREPRNYQDYIQTSKAEFAIAKSGYVVSSCGWFSERSAAYLASGRPVLAQETGFSEWLPAGEGIIAFGSPDEALAGMSNINSRYVTHCQAARAIAEEYFDARKVLARLIDSATRP